LNQKDIENEERRTVALSDDGELERTERRTEVSSFF
jgi:hypothetical protein